MFYNRKPKHYEKDFFQCHNSTIMTSISELGHVAFRIWLILLATSPDFSPNEKWLAGVLKASPATVARGVRELREKGYLIIYPKWYESGKNVIKWVVFESPNPQKQEVMPIDSTNQK